MNRKKRIIVKLCLIYCIGLLGCSQIEKIDNIIEYEQKEVEVSFQERASQWMRDLSKLHLRKHIILRLEHREERGRIVSWAVIGKEIR